MPGNLLFGSGHLDVSSTGFVTETLPSPITLHGFYWIGIKSDSSTVSLASAAANNSAIFFNPTGINPAAGTMRFPFVNNVSGALSSNPTVDSGSYADNSSLWVPVFDS